jgi:hypothetical protein
MKRSEAIYLRSIVEQAATSLDDQTASTAATLFPRLKENGELVRAGVRINWNGTVKKAAVDLWDTKENNPDNAPTLWANLPYKDGYRIIPEIITAPEAFKEGECGWWGDVLYRSKVNGNVYTPAVYPGNWELA